MLAPASGSKDETMVNSICSNIATNETEGIEEWNAESGVWKVYVKEGNVVVESRIGEKVHLYDVAGRELHSIISMGNNTFEVPASGTYLVRVGNQPVRRVVVLK